VVELPRARRVDAAALAAEAWDLPPAPGVLEARLAAPNALVIAAIDREGQIGGVATARILSDGRAVSDETVVHASWRGRRVAAAMIQALADRLRSRGIRVLEGESSSQKLPELAFFQRQGFRVIGEWVANGVEGYADGERIFRTAKCL